MVEPIRERFMPTVECWQTNGYFILMYINFNGIVANEGIDYYYYVSTQLVDNR